MILLPKWQETENFSARRKAKVGSGKSRAKKKGAMTHEKEQDSVKEIFRGRGHFGRERM